MCVFVYGNYPRRREWVVSLLIQTRQSVLDDSHANASSRHPTEGIDAAGQSPRISAGDRLPIGSDADYHCRKRIISMEARDDADHCTAISVRRRI